MSLRLGNLSECSVIGLEDLPSVNSDPVFLVQDWNLGGAPSAEAQGKHEPEVEDTAHFVAGDLETTARAEREVRQGRQDPFGDTRMLIAKQVGSTMLDGADARVLAVYGAPDRFDRHLRITRMFPFFSRETTVHRSDDYA